jgi:hypothetical protein
MTAAQPPVSFPSRAPLTRLAAAFSLVSFPSRAPLTRLAGRRPDQASTSTGGSSTVIIALYGSGEAYASMTAVVATVTVSARSNRIIADHSTSASTAAIAIDVMAHGLNISQPGVPVRAAARPPIQNQPGG